MTVPWKDVVEVRPAGGFLLELRFSDGATGVVDVASLVEFRGVFAGLIDPAVFAAVRVDEETGTLCWPGGADLAPESLYSAVTRPDSPAPSGL
jgi:hypothetical protein